MVRVSGLAAAIMLAAVTPVSAASADAAGRWLHPENGAILALFDCDGDLCLRVDQGSKPGLLDVKNPDDSLRSRPIDGLMILDHAKAAGGDSWKGQLYNTQDGNTYTGTITLLSPAQLQMKGCWLSVFCKTLVFSKIPDQ
jgi:uncharacterized protein (DUF2147 family)